MLETARTTGKFEATGWRMRKDGTRFWAHVLIDALHDDAGRLIGYAKVTRDMSEAREAQERAVEAAERRRQHEAMLRSLMADVKRRWATIDALVGQGTASGYEQAVRQLVELAEAYALTSSREAFDRELRRLLARHGKRTALLRRLREAGLWAG